MNYIGRITSTSIVNGLRNLVVSVYNQFTTEDNLLLPPGVDALPLPGDQCAGFVTDSAGNTVASGVISKINETEEGEHRIYSRDADGLVRAHVFLKNNGDIEIETFNDEQETIASIKIGAEAIAIISEDGKVNLNGTSSTAVAFQQLFAAFNTLKEDYNGHGHPVTGGHVTTGLNGTTSADMTTAERKRVTLGDYTAT